jgi:glycosyltransferase involved in cell wall biosynthesis
MRVGIFHPTYWPEVTRGAERIVHDLAVSVNGAGHDATIVTGHPEAARESVEDGVRVVRCRRFGQPPLFGLHEGFLGHAPNVARHAVRDGFDVVHAFHLTDAWTALKARRLGAPPVVFSYMGIPTRHHLVERRYRLEWMEEVAGGALCTVLSQAAADPFRRYLRRDPLVLPVGLLPGAFEASPNGRPGDTLLFPASIGDRRKRGGLLLEAFAALRAEQPGLRLQVARSRDPFLSPLEFELPDGAEWVEPANGIEMAPVYAGATVTVLPAIDEPFGLVMLESLAAGVPVVAARSGSGPELLDSDAVGRLFEPDDREDLERAIAECLELAGDPGTASACRERAESYRWERIVPDYIAAYERAIAGELTPPAG